MSIKTKLAALAIAALTVTGGQVPLIVLAAPAGYGKTTALRQWAAAGDRPLALGQPGRVRRRPGPARRPPGGRPAGGAGARPTPRRLARIPATEPATAPGRLWGALRELREPALLVLDDVQDVLSPELVALVRGVIESGNPHGFRWRSRPAAGTRSR